MLRAMFAHCTIKIKNRHTDVFLHKAQAGQCTVPGGHHLPVKRSCPNVTAFHFLLMDALAESNRAKPRNRMYAVCNRSVPAFGTRTNMGDRNKSREALQDVKMATLAFFSNDCEPGAVRNCFEDGVAIARRKNSGKQVHTASFGSHVPRYCKRTRRSYRCCSRFIVKTRR
jgi:hypothetical protein